MINFLTLDYIAFAIFLLCWIGYSFFSDWYVRRSENLIKTIHNQRIKWMMNCILREDKGEDVFAIGQLMRSVTFFASTTVLIVAALTPLFGYAEQAGVILSSVPFVHISGSPVWEIKTVILEIIFVYSFFKFTWSLRQYNYSLVMILSSPKCSQGGEDFEQYAKRNALILTNASRHFSLGIRGFYFGLITLSWFLHPVLYLILNIFVVLIIYRREFWSKTLDIVSVK